MSGLSFRHNKLYASGRLPARSRLIKYNLCRRASCRQGSPDVTRKKYSLSQNYPNPFNPVTNIRYDLPVDNFVTIKVFDELGREVLSLVDEHKQAGRYLVSFNAANFSSGIYFYTIQAGNYEYSRRMTLLK